MYLLYGVLCLCVTALLFAVTLLGARNPARPFWATESLVANILSPLILGFLVMGIGFCAKVVMGEVVPGFQEWLYAAVIGVATVVLLMTMGIRKKLAGFDAEEKKRGQLIQGDFQVNRPPETPINDQPDFRRAA